MSKVNLSGVGVGDVLLATRTLQVIRRSGAWAHLEDVESGQRFAVRDGDEQGSWDFEIIKKGKRKYQVGDLISGKEVRDHIWKRGTVIRWFADANDDHDVLYVLLTNGTWKVIGDYDDDVPVVKFSDFHYSDYLDFEIAYLP